MSKKNKKEEKEYQVVKTGSDPKNRIVELIHIPSEIPKESFWGIKKEHYVFESGSEKQAHKDFDFYISCSQTQY